MLQMIVPYLFTYKAHHFFTRKYTCSIEICSRLGVRLITKYFRSTKYNFSKFPDLLLLNWSVDVQKKPVDE